MKRVTHVLLFFTGTWLGVNLLFGWANAIVDSYFYWAFAQFIRTGSYPFIAPFVYDRPTTISPPLYSGLLWILTPLPHPEFVLRLVQTALLVLSALFVYKILKTHTSHAFAIMTACCFVLLPANTIYVNYILSENIAQCFVVILTYLLVNRRIRDYAKAIIIGMVATLAKYSLLVFALFAGVLFLRSRPAPKWYIYPAIGVLLLSAWLWANWSITGVVGLSDTKGIQLYNQIVWVGRATPSEKNSSMQKLRQYVPPAIDIRKAYWDLQGYILPHVHNSWPAVDRILGAVAQNAVREHPILYIQNTAHIFFALHGNVLPYWSNLDQMGNHSFRYPLFCDRLGTFQTCAPLLPTPISIPFWNTFIRIANTFYTYVFPVALYGLFFPSLIAGLFSKQTVWYRLSILYLLGVIPIAMYVHPDTRYIIPFYPLIAAICGFGIWAAIHKVQWMKQNRHPTVSSL